MLAKAKAATEAQRGREALEAGYFPLRIIATVVLEGQRIREDSWNGNGYDYTIREAANKAAGADAHLAELIALLNLNSWNDIQNWANVVLYQTKRSG